MQRWQCNLRGRCERSHRGYPSEAECQSQCQGAEALDIEYLAFQYALADVWQLAPSDQWEVIRRLERDPDSQVGEWLRNRDFKALARVEELQLFLAYSVLVPTLELLQWDSRQTRDLLELRYADPQSRSELFEILLAEVIRLSELPRDRPLSTNIVLRLTNQFSFFSQHLLDYRDDLAQFLTANVDRIPVVELPTNIIELYPYIHRQDVEALLRISRQYHSLVINGLRDFGDPELFYSVIRELGNTPSLQLLLTTTPKRLRDLLETDRPPQEFVDALMGDGWSHSLDTTPEQLEVLEEFYRIPESYYRSVQPLEIPAHPRMYPQFKTWSYHLTSS